MKRKEKDEEERKGNARTEERQRGNGMQYDTNRWALAIACRSLEGFQSLSKMMTVSAAVMLMPRPPAKR